MTLQSSGLYCTEQTFGAASTSPRFKIDRYGDWKEAYPSADYTVTANTSYTICIQSDLQGGDGHSKPLLWIRRLRL